MQLVAGVKPPVALLLKLADPCGHDEVPESVSETVAVQSVDPLIGVLVGVHEVDVDVVRKVTVRPKPIESALYAWTLSLAV